MSRSVSRGLHGQIRHAIGAVVVGVLVRGLPKQVADRRYFDAVQRKGFHVIPTQYHQPIPDTRSLKEQVWQRQSQLVGIDMNQEKQLELLTEVFPRFKAECNFPREKTGVRHEFYRKNGAFLSVDAEVLHCMIRHFRPHRVIEVGSGSTTYLAARACRLNMERDGHKTELYTIDPFPNDVLRGGFPGLSALRQEPLEDVELDFFLQLGDNDIFFVDSSHVSRIGGDVNYAYLEIIPRLGKGVMVHAHDIFMPAEYPRKFVMEDHLFWDEQYILQAFLSFNCAFEVLWSSSYMHLSHPDKLRSVFPSYESLHLDYPFYPNVWPSSFWMRKRRENVL